MIPFSISARRAPDGSILLSCTDSNGVNVFSDMGMPTDDTHGEYALWAEWNNYTAPEDFKVTIQTLVELYDFDGLTEAAPRTIEDALNEVDEAWVGRIQFDNNQDDFLKWEADSVCGLEVIRIARHAEYTMTLWPDVREEVAAAAVKQMLVVCYG